MTLVERDLSPFADPVDIIKAIGQVQENDRRDLVEAVANLIGHADADVRSEVFRLLLVAWKLARFRPLAVSALRDRSEDDEVRMNAAYGLVAVSDEHTREEDLSHLVDVVTDDGEDANIRACAYDALLTLGGRPRYRDVRRTFVPDDDIDWEWIASLVS